MNDNATAFTILVLLAAMIVSFLAGQREVRVRLRKWIDESRPVAEGTRHDGFREALERLEASLVRRRFAVHLEKEGEI